MYPSCGTQLLSSVPRDKSQITTFSSSMRQGSIDLVVVYIKRVHPFYPHPFDRSLFIFFDNVVKDFYEIKFRSYSLDGNDRVYERNRFNFNKKKVYIALGIILLVIIIIVAIVLGIVLGTRKHKTSKKCCLCDTEVETSPSLSQPWGWAGRRLSLDGHIRIYRISWPRTNTRTI